MSDCLFCKIASKLIPAEIVFEDEQTVAFLDIHPRAPGHTVVVSRHHSGNLLDLPDPEVTPLFLAVKRVVQKIGASLKPNGFTIGLNQGEVSGQTIDHLHIHVMPRFEGDGGGSIHSVVSNPPEQSLRDIAQKIRQS